jgi:hypothetical protein
VIRREDGISQKCHGAFAVSLDQLFTAIEELNKHGIETLEFGGHKTYEPIVIGWMPSTQIYFRDPDEHMLELITILPDAPKPTFIGAYSGWKQLTEPTANQS